MVDITLDPDLTVVVEPGEDTWTYRVAVVRGGETVTRYGTNADPRTASGRTMLRNIIGQRVDGYTKDRAEELLDRAFRDYQRDLADELG